MSSSGNESVGEDESVEESLLPGSSKLFFFFGGIAGAIGMPPYEFYRAGKILEFSKIFVRDPNQAWYQRGIPGVGDDARTVGKYLEQKIKESGATDIRFVGNSMGGFAALMFCSMLRCGSAVAFAPQTFVSPSKRREHRDMRWAEKINRMHATRRDSDIYELKSWIASNHPLMKAKVFVSTSCALDDQHADELSGFANIDVQRLAEGGHGVVKMLRNDGTLEKILRGDG